MSNEERRSFSREFKLKVIKRLEAGESGSALALELSVKRTIIYRWRDAWREGGPEALRSTRPPAQSCLSVGPWLQSDGQADLLAQDLVEHRRGHDPA